MTEKFLVTYKILNILKDQKSDYTNSFRSLENHLTGKIIPKGYNIPDSNIQMELWLKD